MTFSAQQPDTRTLPAVLSHNAAKHADSRFLSYGDTTITWAEIWTTARAMSVAFERLGVSRGDTVIVALDNCPEFIESWFGLATLGAIEVPVNPELSGTRLRHVLNHSAARLAVVSAAMVEAIEALAEDLDSLEHLVVLGEAIAGSFSMTRYGDLDRAGDDYVDRVVTPADPVAIMYTSGSSGPAKGVIMPHGQHFTNAEQAAAAAKITSNDVVFLCLPLHHNMSQGYGVWPALLAGASVHLVSRFSRRTFWDEVNASGATIFPFVGGLLALLDDLPPTETDGTGPYNSLRVAYGVPIPPDLYRKFERRFDLKLIHCYGSTEATIPVWATSDTPVGAAGRVVAGFDVRILGESDWEVPVGESGEICVRPHKPFSMLQGYYRDPTRTVSAFRNLWFHSGDRGMFDTDGNLWYKGRIDDVIRRFGEFIDALELEVVIGAHPGVLAAAAIGVPSELAEEEVMLVVVRASGSEITADEVRDHLAERLPRFAVPRFVEFADALPLTPTGKVEKYKLRERGVTATTNDVREPRK